MTIIPNFLLKRLYVNGSLRATNEGVAFDVKNTIGPGMLTRIHRVLLNDLEVMGEHIKVLLEGNEVPASHLSDENPLAIFLNQTLTCVLTGVHQLQEGINKLTVELTSKEAGFVSITVNDTV